MASLLAVGVASGDRAMAGSGRQPARLSMGKLRSQPGDVRNMLGNLYSHQA